MSNIGKCNRTFAQPDTLPYHLLALTAISGEFPADQLKRLRGSDYYKESVITALKKDGYLRTYYRDKLRGYQLMYKMYQFQYQNKNWMIIFVLRILQKLRQENHVAQML